MPNAIDRLSKLNAEKCLLDLSTWSSLVTLTKAIWGGKGRREAKLEWDEKRTIHEGEKIVKVRIFAEKLATKENTEVEC